ncbi:hypothetical protein [Streptomyces sp. 3N207]|uniref:hypothetical protein n=1 Tax=Streptomyces sp. 3N207 TaxID=3457417 RepID=UPI003FCFB974
MSGDRAERVVAAHFPPPQRRRATAAGVRRAFDGRDQDASLILHSASERRQPRTTAHTELGERG